MTHQEFNCMYYRFTKNERGIRLKDQITTNGYELKEFVEFVLSKMEGENQTELNLTVIS